MTLPATVRINARAPFPSIVTGSGPITLSKVNGVWAVGINYNLLGIQIPPAQNFATDYVAIYDSLADTFFRTPLASITTGATSPSQRIVTAAGAVTVLVSDQMIILNKVVGAATNILLPVAMSRGGVPVTVKDLKGDANVNNITLVPNGTETIDGYSPAAAIANGRALISIINGSKTLYPLIAGGGWIII